MRWSDLRLSDLRGTAQLACDATIGITSVVERMHGTILRVPLPVGPMRRRPDAGLAKLVYGSIRGTTRLVDRVIGTALDPWLEPTPSENESPEREALLAAPNGAFGDHLARSDNPLALPMELRPAESTQASTRSSLSPSASGHGARWLILVHGLCMNDRQWHRGGHDHGRELARAHGFRPVYLRYNTGLSVADNGAQFAETLEAFLQRHGRAEDEVVILGHSLGGLVARSAAGQARARRYRWAGQLRQLIFLGTPHAGSPVAAGGRAIDLALSLSPYAAPLSRLTQARSEGLRDLHRGLGADLSGLPEGVVPHAIAGAIAGTLRERPGRPGQNLGQHLSQHLGQNLMGDGLVTVPSALARQRAGSGAAGIRPEHQRVLDGVGHFDLLSDRAVFDQLARWLA